MKALIVILLLIIPIVHADSVLDTRKANLEEKAKDFISQIDVVVSFASDKTGDVSELESLKSEFQNGLKEALESETKEILLEKEKDMREVADNIRKYVKASLKDYLDELKEAIHGKEKSITSKIKETARDIGNATSNEDMSVEEAKETLRNSFSIVVRIYDSIKSFISNNSNNVGMK